MNLRSVKQDENSQPVITPREGMRELAIVIRDVFVGLLAFIGGVAIHGWMRGPFWLVPLSMVPLFCWIWWRGVIPRKAWPTVLFIFFAFTLYFFLKEQFWPNRAAWWRWVDMSFSSAVLWTAHYIGPSWNARMRRFHKPDSISDGER